MDVAAMAPPRYRPYSRLEEKWRRARTCYDHLAAQLGIGLAESLCSHGHLVLGEEGGDITPSGDKFLSKFGVDLGKRASGGGFSAALALIGRNAGPISEEPLVLPLPIAASK